MAARAMIRLLSAVFSARIGSAASPAASPHVAVTSEEARVAIAKQLLAHLESLSLRDATEERDEYETGMTYIHDEARRVFNPPDLPLSEQALRLLLQEKAGRESVGDDAEMLLQRTGYNQDAFFAHAAPQTSARRWLSEGTFDKMLQDIFGQENRSIWIASLQIRGRLQENGEEFDEYDVNNVLQYSAGFGPHTLRDSLQQMLRETGSIPVVATGSIPGTPEGAAWIGPLSRSSIAEKNSGRTRSMILVYKPAPVDIDNISRYAPDQESSRMWRPSLANGSTIRLPACADSASASDDLRTRCIVFGRRPRKQRGRGGFQGVP